MQVVAIFVSNYFCNNVVGLLKVYVYDGLTLLTARCPPNLLCQPFLNRTGRESKMEKHLGQDTYREITHQLLSQAKQTHLEKTNLIYC